MNLLMSLRPWRVRPWGQLSEAVLLVVFVRIGLRITRYARLRACLGRIACVRTRTAASISEVTWAVGAVGHRITGTTCLAEALAADTMLRRRGHAPLLRVGVRRGDHSLLDAHAWVECEGRVVLGEVPEITDYAILA